MGNRNHDFRDWLHWYNNKCRFKLTIDEFQKIIFIALNIFLYLCFFYVIIGPSWSSSYGSWIYNYLCNPYLSLLNCEFEPCLWRSVLDTTLCDKVCQWLATCHSSVVFSWYSSFLYQYSWNIVESGVNTINQPTIYLITYVFHSIITENVFILTRQRYGLTPDIGAHLYRILDSYGINPRFLERTDQSFCPRIPIPQNRPMGGPVNLPMMQLPNVIVHPPMVEIMTQFWKTLKLANCLIFRNKQQKI